MRKILKSIFMILAVLAVVGGTSWAYFSDSSEIQGITFSTGNADLKMSQVCMHSWVDGNVTLDQFNQGVGDWCKLKFLSLIHI